jgi:S-ribosylhomocysteine lyase
MADLDHRLMTPPSLRITSTFRVADGPSLQVWDLRLAQPNVSHVAMPTVHSLEHFLGDYFARAAAAIRNGSPLHRGGGSVLGVAPMGCQTGFYIYTAGIDEIEEMSEHLARALESIETAREVPLANTVQCGWAENHSLAGAQELARWLLSRRSSWQHATLATTS